MNVKEKIEYKILISKEVAFRLNRRSETLRRAGGGWEGNSTQGARNTVFNQEGTITFDIHTHPIGREGNPRLGFGVAGHGDLNRVAIYSAYYILSERNGLTQYFPGVGRGLTEADRLNHTRYPLVNTVPSTLQKHLRVKP